MALTSCCCGCSLKTGTTLVGCISLVFSTTVMAASLLFRSTFSYLNSNPVDTTLEEASTTGGVVLSIMLSLMSVELFLAIILLVGVYKKIMWQAFFYLLLGVSLLTLPVSMGPGHVQRTNKQSKGASRQNKTELIKCCHYGSLIKIVMTVVIYVLLRITVTLPTIFWLYIPIVLLQIYFQNVVGSYLKQMPKKFDVDPLLSEDIAFEK